MMNGVNEMDAVFFAFSEAYVRHNSQLFPVLQFVCVC